MGLLKSEDVLEQIEEEASKEAILYVNGSRKVLPDGLAHLTLLEYLRRMVNVGLLYRLVVSSIVRHGLVDES